MSVETVKSKQELIGSLVACVSVVYMPNKK